jgi:hypothetical protein
LLERVEIMKNKRHSHGAAPARESVAHANKGEMHEKPREDQFPKASDMKPGAQAEKAAGDCEKPSGKK